MPKRRFLPAAVLTAAITAAVIGLRPSLVGIGGVRYQARRASVSFASICAAGSSARPCASSPSFLPARSARPADRSPLPRLAGRTQREVLGRPHAVLPALLFARARGLLDGQPVVDPLLS